MTLKEFGELVIWIGAVCTAIAAISVIMHFVVVRPIRNWIKEQIGQPVKDTAAHLETSNDTSAGEYIETTSNTVDKVRSELGQLHGELRLTNSLAMQTNVLALDNKNRLDKHQTQITDQQAQLIDHQRQLDDHQVEGHGGSDE